MNGEGAATMLQQSELSSAKRRREPPGCQLDLIHPLVYGCLFQGLCFVMRVPMLASLVSRPSKPNT